LTKPPKQEVASFIRNDSNQRAPAKESKFVIKASLDLKGARTALVVQAVTQVRELIERARRIQIKPKINVLVGSIARCVRLLRFWS
jgi:hypothetical protein